MSAKAKPQRLPTEFYSSPTLASLNANAAGFSYVIANVTRLENYPADAKTNQLYDSIVSSGKENGCSEFFRQAIANQALQNYATALEFFAIASKCSGDEAMTLLNTGVIRVALEDLHFASENYVVDVMIAPRKSPSVAQTDKKDEADYSLALADFSRLCHDQQDNAFAWYNLATTKLLMKNYNRAIDDYSEAIRLEPTLGEAYYNRALTLIFLGEDKLACADLSKAGELGISEAYSVIRKYCNK